MRKSIFGKLLASLLLAWGTTLAVAAQNEQQQYQYIVAQDGTGQFTTVQEAINAVPDFRKGGPTRIYIKKGVYKEKLNIPGTKDGVHLVGEDGVVLTYDDYASKPNCFDESMGTSGSASVYVFGPNFVAENITFENSSGPVGQAVACHIGGDKAIFRRCRFLGFQDTLYTFGEYARQYFEDCYVEGTVDFIFGKAQAVFNRCHIHSKSGGYVTAPATPKGRDWGYVFFDCKLTADEGITQVRLSRPWRPYGQAVFIRCYLGPHITPEGWDNWGNTANEKTAYYAEYMSYGPGANPEKRAAWAHQLTSIEKYDMATLLRGDDDWNPIATTGK